jgi:hypothetical protein
MVFTQSLLARVVLVSLVLEVLVMPLEAITETTLFLALLLRRLVVVVEQAHQMLQLKQVEMAALAAVVEQ